MSASNNPWYPRTLTLLAISAASACGSLYTENARRSTIDPSILDTLPERDERGAWPQDSLPSSGVVFADGTGARFLDDYIVVRPTGADGLQALLSNHPYLKVASRLPFQGDSREFLFPRGDLWISSDGTVNEVEVDVLLQVDWSAFEEAYVRAVPATEDDIEATFSSRKAEILIRIARMLERQETRKIASAKPVTLSVLLADPGVNANSEPVQARDCPCIDVASTPPRFESSMVVDMNGDLLECGAGLYTAGTNMLMLESASINLTEDPDGQLQDVRLWILPHSEEPIHLPGLGALPEGEGSVQQAEAFASWKPMLAHGMSLAGPVSDGSRCGWLSSPSNGTLTFQNAGQWYWSDPTRDETVTILAYESDPGVCIHGLYCAGLDDDLIGVTVVNEAETQTGVNQYGIKDLTLSLHTYEECTEAECDPDPHDCSSPVNDLDPELLGTPCPPDDDPLIDNVCIKGTYVCLDNGIVCADTVYKASEICNGEDDDCNGVVDDGPWLGVPCSADEAGVAFYVADEQQIQIGENPPVIFRSSCDYGTKACVEIAASTHQIQCIGAIGPEGPESCDSEVGKDGETIIEDENCDGAFNETCICDEGLDPPRDCGLHIGDCNLGKQVCDGAGWSGCCTGAAAAQPECNGTEGVEQFHLPADQELCGGGDENCNGIVDIEITNACGQCVDNVEHFLPMEVCNGVDDNCDGAVDEGLVNACMQCLDAIPPEICNGVDDDCDGDVDEGLIDGLAVNGTSFTHVTNSGIQTVNVPNPAGDVFGYVVFISEYANGNDDDYEFYVSNCINDGVQHSCDVDSFGAGGSASISGQLIVVGAQAGFSNVGTLPNWTVPNGTCEYFPFTGSEDLLITGVSSYITATDDDFGFVVEPSPQPGGGQAVYSCGFGGNGGSQASGFTMQLGGLCDSYVLPVNAVVFNDEDVSIIWPGRTGVWPLLGITAYIPNTDDDPNWLVDCYQAGVDYRCDMSVHNGNNGSHIRVRGLLLDMP